MSGKSRKLYFRNNCCTNTVSNTIVVSPIKFLRRERLDCWHVPSVARVTRSEAVFCVRIRECKRACSVHAYVDIFCEYHCLSPPVFFLPMLRKVCWIRSIRVLVVVVGFDVKSSKATADNGYSETDNMHSLKM